MKCFYFYNCRNNILCVASNMFLHNWALWKWVIHLKFDYNRKKKFIGCRFLFFWNLIFHDKYCNIWSLKYCVMVTDKVITLKFLISTVSYTWWWAWNIIHVVCSFVDQYKVTMNYNIISVTHFMALFIG